ncbi:MAG: glycosyltransferase [Candidatus Moranbacteria bacterium]|nr:glycosyltransferase [Candidatus Moranbacteria bacterium]
MLDVCIIVPTYNNEDYTIRCFNSIYRNTDLKYKIIWIDNASSIESRNKVDNFVKKTGIPMYKIFNKKNKGFIDATNQGIKIALKLDPDYIVFQNNDTEVYKNWINDYIEIAESNPDIGIVGPITSPCDSWQSIDNLKIRDEQFINYPAYDNNPKEYSKLIRKKYYGKVKQVDHMVAFFSTLFKIETIKQVGLLSKTYGIGFGDDDDYCNRALDKGWQIVLAIGIFVFHNHRTTFKTLYTEEEIVKMQSKNLRIFKNKHKTTIFLNKIKFALFTPHKFVKKYFEKYFLI